MHRLDYLKGGAIHNCDSAAWDVQMRQAGYQRGANSQGLLDASRVNRI